MKWLTRGLALHTSLEANGLELSERQRQILAALLCLRQHLGGE